MKVGMPSTHAADFRATIDKSPRLRRAARTSTTRCSARIGERVNHLGALKDYLA